MGESRQNWLVTREEHVSGEVMDISSSSSSASIHFPALIHLPWSNQYCASNLIRDIRAVEAYPGARKQIFSYQETTIITVQPQDAAHASVAWVFCQ